MLWPFHSLVIVIWLNFFAAELEGCASTVRENIRLIKQSNDIMPSYKAASQSSCSNEGLFYISTMAKCEYENVSISCKEALLPGTIVHITCRYGYRKLRDHITCQPDGQWDYHPWEQCQETCYSTNANGDNGLAGAPWHATIYSIRGNSNSFELLCSGTIITSKLVLTHVFCVGAPFQNYRIGIGKSYSDNMAVEPMPYQMLNMSGAMRISGANTFAVAKLSDFIIFRPHIAPICIAEIVERNLFTVAPGNPANVNVSVWDNQFQQTLFTLGELPTHENKTCAERLNSEIQPFLSDGVLCMASGHNSESVFNSTDTGAAFTIPKTEGGIVSYFFFGMRIADSKERFIFTNISDLLEIKPLLQYHQFYHIITPDNKSRSDYSSNEYCSWDYWSDPSIMASCNYNNLSQACIEPILPNTVVEIECQKGYRKLIDSNLCNDSGEWVGLSNPCKASSSCTLPDLPPYQRAYYEGSEDEIPSGQAIDEFVSVVHHCDKDNNYYLNGTSENLCLNGAWFPDTPNCQKYCPPIYFNNATTKIDCKYKNYPIPCGQPLLPGTIASMACQFGYERPSIYSNDVLTCLENGNWSDPVYKCKLICGAPPPDGVTYIVGGESVSNTVVPWHAAIYRVSTIYLRHICSGTIINRKVVLSAAHCFYTGTTLLDPSNFRVVTGKYYRDFGAEESLPIQSINVQEIKIPQNYQGYDGLYEADLAVVILADSLKLTHYVMPICIEDELKDVPLVQGQVVGWGLTESEGSSSIGLREIYLPAIEREQCRNLSPPEFQRFITMDKFCAGFSAAGKSVCQGDSGGGFIFPKNVNDKLTYYLRGIVSVGPRRATSCDSEKYSAFTRIHSYIDMIRESAQYDDS